jgi:glycosyltransferase involved in cell wall biosynthesis
MSDSTPHFFSRYFSSTIIATVGRSTLARAVESVLSQNDLAEKMEVIVVNDSGSPLVKEQWQRSDYVTVLNTMKRERCVARNAGAAIARGRYVHFLDDDDYMLPGAFKTLYEIACTSEAHLIYGLTKFTDGNQKPTWEFHLGAIGDTFIQVMAGSWLPLQASLIKIESFFKTGGFDQRLVGLEQKDLTRRVARLGAFASTSEPVACVIQDWKSSTSDHTLSKTYSVWSRDNILSESGSFGRMLSSATTPYWRGKMVRAYLTCVVWQMRKRNPIEVFRRAYCAVAGLALSFFSLFSRDFWNALLHES